jgi:tetratricopeptide (TPR) repeat protein
MGQLRLEVRDFEGPLRWRWLLCEESSGTPLADHLVDLAGAPGEFAAFTDLYRYLRHYAVPDRRTASEAEIAGRVGAWAADVVLGQRVCGAIVAAAPATVRIVVPERAGFVVSWPLELAHAGGRPLAARGDVTLAYDLARDPAGRSQVSGPGTAATGSSLRMLAVFSLPTATSVLALRRERFELARLVRQIAARQRRRVGLTVVQYGATRERLAAVAEAGDGWDVLHLSGHGGRGQFLLEKADGSPDPVDTGELLGLLAPLRRRVRLAVVSACESAAATTAETLRWVGLEEQAQQFDQQAAQEVGAPAAAGSGAEPVMTGVARAVAAELGCAVVAMRYPVVDDFAVAFTEELYERLLGVRDAQAGSRGQPLGAALARAVARAAGPEPTPARPVLSLATPVLLGGQAGLVLQVPRGQPELDPAEVRMEAFPPEPERFVGRAQAMAEASAVLASDSGHAGVLLHGMAGSGKTACALELAYRHQDSFAAAAFWQAPLTDDEFGGALASLAIQLEVQLGEFGFAMSDKITTIESLTRFTPRLRRLLEDAGILLVLDNLETLLTPSGTWRDPRWEPLMAALTGHAGESRMILTSRIPPTGLSSAVLPLPVHALDLAESAALARELPGLRALLHADAGPERDADQTTVAADRDLVRRVLHVVQGHPKLMELADAAAADPARLTTQVDAAETAAGGQALDAFFRDGTTALDAAQFLDALTTWTATTLGQLLGPAQLMAQFLACLEEADRQSWILDANWDHLWRRLRQPGDPPGPAPLLAALTAAALIQPDPALGKDHDSRASVTYRMHPGIAETIRATAPGLVQAATDTELSATWRQVSDQAQQQEGGEAGQAIIRAGLAAAPYLLRLQGWETAAALLERALIRDESPATIQAALPTLQAIADATQAPEALGLMARSLAGIDPAGAETLLRSALAQAAADQNFKVAAATARALGNLLRDAGRLREALDLASQTAEYNSRAGHGPWNQLDIEALQLQILGQMGQHRQVLDRIRVLQDRMDKLPAKSVGIDTIEPWNVREVILSTGCASSYALGEWQLALDLNAALLASMRARGASVYEIIGFRYNDTGPLIELGRLADAERILLETQQVYEDQDDIAGLQQVLNARAVLEDTRGRSPQALELERTAIRLGYVRPEPAHIANSHHNLAHYLQNMGVDPETARAHRLAAALLYRLTGMTHEFGGVSRALAWEVRQDASREDMPSTVDEVIRVAEQTEGVRLDQLITALQPDRQAVADALAEILRTAASSNSEQDPVIQDHLQQLEPVIAATVAAAGGESQAAAQLTPFLDQLAQDSDWAALAAVLRRIIGGDRDASLLRGLDPADTAIASQVLARLAQPPDAPAQEDP